MTSILYAAEGDLVDVYGEVLAVKEYLMKTDELVLTNGQSFFAQDIEAIPLGDDIEAFLDGPAFRVRIRPKPNSIETVRCNGGTRVGNESVCTCSQCYSNISFGEFVEEIHAREIIEKHHFVDNAACTCAAKGCPCAE